MCFVGRKSATKEKSFNKSKLCRKLEQVSGLFIEESCRPPRNKDGGILQFTCPCASLG